ncbi:hypothetical protein M0R04_16100 [Candidatus Dojkabacteria bacterium]|jgi:hypothetical protein|nr:hypothetical protein [Candidatus Dojkabacteria bacterium]
MTKPTIIDYKVNDLSGDVDKLKTDVTRILENHLPHIQNNITELKGDINSLSTKVTNAVAVNIVLVIAGVVGVILLVR